MSKIDELIQNLCPDGVGYFKLKDVSEMKRGTSFSKKNSVIGEYPVISGGKEPAFYCDKYNRDGETITVAGSGAGAGYVQYWNKKIFVADAFSLKGNEYINTKFLYYLLTNIQQDIYSKKTGGGIPHVHISDLENVYIPLPPMEVQSEIVRILDKFTLLTAELTEQLTAELTARKKQYEYYRDNLLNFKCEAPIMKLEDILTIKNGRDYKSLKEGNIPVYGTGGIMTYVDSFAYDGSSVLIPRKGSLDKLYYVEGKFWTVDTIFYTVINEQVVVPKYIYYYLQNKHLEKMNLAGGVPSLTQSTLNKIELPVPSLEIQQRLVNVLDNFDSICSDLKIGLPAEIEARKKQYEYYREKLLTFVDECGKHTHTHTHTHTPILENKDLTTILQYVFGYVSVKIGNYFTKQKGTSITAGEMKNIENSEGDVKIFAGGKTVVTAMLKDIKNARIITKPAVLIQSRGLIDVIYYDKPFTFKNEMWAYTTENQITVKYLFYYLKTKLDVLRNKAGIMGSMPQISLNDTENMIIPMPSLKEQERIVSILDKFDSYCNDLSQGLPAEIEARQKQYEYYRDKLLKFKPLEK